MKRTITFILSLLLVISLLTGCATGTPKAEPSPAKSAGALYKAGTYSAAAQGNNGPVTVSVTFDDNAITNVTVDSHEETAGLSDPAIEGIPAAVVEQQSLDIDTVSGATYTSEAILTAIEDCVVQAGGDAEALKAAVNGAKS